MQNSIFYKEARDILYLSFVQKATMHGTHANIGGSEGKQMSGFALQLKNAPTDTSWKPSPEVVQSWRDNFMCSV